jgi:hypothetical protein
MSKYPLESHTAHLTKDRKSHRRQEPPAAVRYGVDLRYDSSLRNFPRWRVFLSASSAWLSASGLPKDANTTQPGLKP